MKKMNPFIIIGVIVAAVFFLGKGIFLGEIVPGEALQISQPQVGGYTPSNSLVSVGQSFIPQTDFLLTKIKLRGYRSPSLLGNVLIELKQGNGDGSVLYSTAIPIEFIRATTPTGIDFNLSFETPQILLHSTQPYFLVISTPNAVTTSDKINMAYSGSDTSYPFGSRYSKISGTWTASIGDLTMEIWGVPQLECTENWQCTSWSDPVNSCGSRTCTDSNSCGTNDGKPLENLICTVTCTENWQCSEWSTCSGETQSRACTDSNACGTTDSKPSEIQSCTVVLPTSPQLVANPLGYRDDFTYDSINWDTPSAIIDENYNTFAAPSGSPSESHLFIYYTNVDPTNLKWQVKDGQTDGESIRNLTLPQGCTSQNPVKLEIFGHNLGSASYMEYYCYTSSTSSTRLYITNLGSGNTPSSKNFYEQGLWNTASPVCNTSADTNCNGQVDRTELGSAISQWLSGSITRSELGAVIQAWVTG